MSNKVFHCENCGAQLGALNSICWQCAPEFSQINIDPKIGKYVCPNCARRFDRACVNLWPPNAKWYWPQIFKPQCPHCDVFLRDRKIVHRSNTEICVIPFLIFASVFSPWRPATQLFLFVPLIVIDFVRWWHAKNGIAAEEDKYAVEQSS